MAGDTIGRRPPAPPPKAPPTSPPAVGSRPKARVGTPPPADKAAVDRFTRQARAEVQAGLQAAGLPAAPPPRAGRDDVAALTATFATLLRRERPTDRAGRARLFARAVLRRPRLRRLFGGLPEREMEQMCDIIGEVLDRSPIFAQWVDDVTEGAVRGGRP